MDTPVLVYCYRAPRQCYPRYSYSYEHADNLCLRYNDILRSLDLSDNFPIPVFEDVIIFFFTENESELLSCSKVCSVQSDKVTCKKLSLEEYNSSYKKKSHSGSTIFISYTFFDDFRQLLESQIILLTCINGSIPQAADTDGIVKSSIEDLALNICLLLERAVLRTLFERTRTLQCLLQLQEEKDVFNDYGIKFETLSELTQKIITEDEDNTVKKNIHSLQAQEVVDAKLKATEKLVMTQYKNTSIEFQETIRAKICHRKQPEKEFLTEQLCEGILTQIKNEGREYGQYENENIVRRTVNDYQIFHNLEKHVTQMQEAYKEHVLQVRKRKDDLEQIHGEMQSMYYRSKVPKTDRPPVLPDMNMDLNERVTAEILAVNGVTSIGYRFRILNIFIDQSLDNESMQRTEDTIKHILQKEHISEYRFQYEQKSPKLLREAGSPVFNERKGTLGGFARLGTSEDLCILMSNHVANYGSDIYLSSSGSSSERKLFARVLPRKIYSGKYDIAIAKVVPEKQVSCQELFKDFSGNCLPSRLYMFEDLDWLEGLPVHIWGASTSPGVGVIDIVDVRIPKMSEKLLRVIDRAEGQGKDVKRFATEGDSGAVVCANDPDGKFIHVIAMLIGCSNFEDLKNNPKKRGEYLVLRLRNGLDQIKAEQQEQILRLC